MITELEKFGRTESCYYCKSREVDKITYGRIYKGKSGNNEITIHYFCLLLSINPQNGKDDEGILGFLFNDIMQTRELCRVKLCIYCGISGASVRCSQKKCLRHFHLPCGLKNGTFHEFYNSFMSFCHEHRKYQRVPNEFLQSRSDGFECGICREVICPYRKAPDIIWASCCKKNSWLHRKCVQEMAMNAGYFFKCPYCSNEENFRTEMKKCGIYIPDQDASWEREPGAFGDLYQRYKHCDAEKCYCHKGRDFVKDEEASRWSLLLCELCGSQGIHLTCSGKTTENEWRCPACTKVASHLKESRGEETPLVSKSNYPKLQTNVTRKRPPTETEDDGECSTPIDEDEQKECNEDIYINDLKMTVVKISAEDGDCCNEVDNLGKIKGTPLIVIDSDDDSKDEEDDGIATKDDNEVDINKLMNENVWSTLTLDGIPVRFTKKLSACESQPAEGKKPVSTDSVSMNPIPDRGPHSTAVDSESACSIAENVKRGPRNSVIAAAAAAAASANLKQGKRRNINKDPLFISSASNSNAVISVASAKGIPGKKRPRLINNNNGDEIIVIDDEEKEDDKSDDNSDDEVEFVSSEIQDPKRISEFSGKNSAMVRFYKNGIWQAMPLSEIKKDVAVRSVNGLTLNKGIDRNVLQWGPSSQLNSLYCFTEKPSVSLSVINRGTSTTNCVDTDTIVID